MSATPTATAKPARSPGEGPSFLDPAALPFGFCPGCGHGRILEALDQALVRLGRDPQRVVIVTDIGCVGLSDRYFRTNSFHGLHGRSVTYATGIKLADPDLTVVVLMGDGGAGIGGHHLINAARRNVGVTLLVFNNLNFGMTGGQHSVTTPAGGRTSTTPGGNLERPLDLCATVAANGAGWVGRTTVFDRALPERILEALTHPGFALLDIWELCTAYYVPNNRFSKAALEQTLSELQMPVGVLVGGSGGDGPGGTGRTGRQEYAAALRQAAQEARGQAGEQARPQAGDAAGEPERDGRSGREAAALPRARRPAPLEPRYAASLRGRLALVVAGAAGQKIRSSVGLVGRAAVLSGLWATQRDDYPVTVMSGHSVSELVLDTAPVEYTGISSPEVLVLLAPEGLKQWKRWLTSPGGAGAARIYVEAALLDQIPESARRRVHVLDTRPLRSRIGAKNTALAALAAVIRQEGWLPLEALEAAAALDPRPELRAQNLGAIAAGCELALE